MDFIVVRIIYLEKEEEEIDLMINQSAQGTLNSFCKWQKTVNPKDVKHPNHHDIAILLTRYDICTDDMTNCGLLGLANVAAACTADKPCAINEDVGLILGIVVAHEIGHVLGCGHDSQGDSPCKAQAEDESFYVMSPYVHMHCNVWSPCSRGFISTFLEKDLGECLNDEPSVIRNKELGMPPGSIYDAVYQCNLMFPGASVCKTDKDKFCRVLMCKTDPTSCMSNGEPPADGTKCAENMWCFDKKCVEIGERPTAVNGGWGEWGKWTDCSRSCGGGLSYSERECNNPVPKHKGRYCLGERKKVKTCNNTPCPEGSKSFRAVQCSEFDRTPFQGKLYRWKPYFMEEAPCALYCVNTDRIYTKQNPVVKDGTSCKAGTKNMCIAGECVKIGCDSVIGSNAVEDHCGVCKGDGTQCKLVDKIFDETKGHRYVKFATVFKGSRHISLEELKPSKNTLAVSDANGKRFYLNGGFMEGRDGTVNIGGVDGLYEHPEPDREVLVIAGPLKEDIVLYVSGVLP